MDLGVLIRFITGTREFFLKASRLALGSTQSHVQWVPGAFFLGVKWTGHEATYLHLVPRLLLMLYPLWHLLHDVQGDSLPLPVAGVYILIAWAASS